MYFKNHTLERFFCEHKDCSLVSNKKSLRSYAGISSFVCSGKCFARLSQIEFAAQDKRIALLILLCTKYSSQYIKCSSRTFKKGCFSVSLTESSFIISSRIIKACVSQTSFCSATAFESMWILWYKSVYVWN